MTTLRNFDSSGVGFDFFDDPDPSSPTLVSKQQIGLDRYLATYRYPDGKTGTAEFFIQSGTAYLETMSYFTGAVKTAEATGINMSVEEIKAAKSPVAMLEHDDWIYGNRFNDKMSGYSGDDVVSGNAGRDLLKGDSGDDSLIGGKGDDTLYGGAGRDNLSGGLGKDIMYGDVGRDTFAFSRPNESLVGQDHDEIVGFDHAHDMISLSAMDADTTTRGNGTFAFSGTRAALHSVWYVENERGIIVCGDVDGVRGADFQIFLSGATHLSKADFIL